jgi:DNA polymerase III delta prime subunit
VLGIELQRVLTLLAAHLARQRRRGRSAAVDALSGYAIEEGEAEGLIAELTESLQEAPRVAVPSTPEAASGPEATAAAARDPREAGVLEAMRPLLRAARAFELTGAEYDALLLALAVELDGRFARLVAFLNDHVGRTRPTLGLAVAIAQAPVRSSVVALTERPLIRDGLLELEGEGPLSGQALRVSQELLTRLVAEVAPVATPAGMRHHPLAPALLEELVLSDEARGRLRHWAERVRRGGTAPLMLTGAPGVGRRTAAHAALSAAGRPMIELSLAELLPEQLRAARREARWHAAGLLLRLPDEPRALDVGALWAALASLPLPLVLTGSAALLEAAAALAPREPLSVALAPPGLEQRVLLWRRLLHEDALAPGEIDELAARFQFNPRTIARAIRRARAAPGPEGHGQGAQTFAALAQSCRELGNLSMGAIAQRMPLPYRREELVLPARLLRDLELAVAWVRKKRQVFEAWGFSERVGLGRGLTALFAGEPGTGKTMAAQVLARELGLELYRVDLSRVMSKYIGETEKNLSLLFDQAQASGAVLFFDEADALFGKRSAVKDAHDRYANVEIGYLLQRMEEHEGVTVLATNRMGDLDEAFIRRFYFILSFPMPGVDERLRIWRGMLPAALERAPELDLTALARDFELSGGEIRNSVLAAAFLAASESSPVTLRHLKRGRHRELLKNGRLLDGRQRQALEE